MPRYVSNTFLRLTLQGVKKISGPQYPLLLEQAGLARYLQTLPPPDDHPCLPAPDYARLTEAVYQMLGEPLTRLFLRNLGADVAHRILQIPMMAQWRAEVGALPPDQRLAWFVRWIAAINNQNWAASTVREEATAWYLDVDQCPACLRIRGAGAPLCAHSSTLYLVLVEPMLSRKVRIGEIQCGAMGDPCCTFAFTK
jgi:hypothetical protein